MSGLKPVYSSAFRRTITGTTEGGGGNNSGVMHNEFLLFKAKVAEAFTVAANEAEEARKKQTHKRDEKTHKKQNNFEESRLRFDDQDLKRNFYNANNGAFYNALNKATTGYFSSPGSEHIQETQKALQSLRLFPNSERSKYANELAKVAIKVRDFNTANECIKMMPESDQKNRRIAQLEAQPGK